MLSKLLQAIIPARWRPIGYLAKLVLDRTNRRVVAGPFAGMQYIQSSYYSAYVPKLLGIYEKELGASIEAAVARRPDTIIDVGAAEGYYAVGLALRNPQARVVAYEMDQQARKYLEELAVLNRTENRVEIRGRCDPADLDSSLEGTERPLVVCDVEGYESALLDPEVVGGLAKAQILVELHDFAVPGIAEIIGQRFARTHRITPISETERTSRDLPYSTWYTALLPERYLKRAIGEWRGEKTSWLWMEPA